MFSKVISAAVCGIESRIISVEADVSDGLPGFTMVGYLTSEVREAQERVRTALRNSGYPLRPKRITVNLSPADIRKSGSGFDLPIAVAVMVSYGYLPYDEVKDIFFAGELSLDGRVLGIHGILGMVMEAKQTGCRICMVPEQNAREAAAIQGVEIYGVRNLRQVVEHVTTSRKMEKTAINIEEKFQTPHFEGYPDFADVHGQRVVKRAAEIAAAGMHNLLISGPPGAGKTMIARRIPSILPPLTLEESLEVSRIHSVAGVLPEEGVLTERPFRMPHHTVSPVALSGGGSVPRPGEISLAHRGILYLDELPEFQKETLEILRQPLEEGEVRIARNSGSYVFPAEFMLVASRNPCPCGFYPDRTKCNCREQDVRRYLGRISHPLLDRIDLHVEAEQMQYGDLNDQRKEETSEQIRNRVEKAHQMQKERYADSRFHFNSELPPSVLAKYCEIEGRDDEKLRGIYEKKHLTARAYHRMLKVARTIADLEGSEKIRMEHLSEAVCYRPSQYLM